MRRRRDHLRAAARPQRSSARGRRWGAYLLSIIAIVSIAWSAREHEAAASAVAAPDTAASPLDRMIERAEHVGRLWREVEHYYEREIAPIERVLLRYRGDPVLARRIAMALVYEARAVQLEPRLLLAVLLVENPWLDPKARSPVGAVGLMQVMPQHEGKWPPCPSDLEDVEANICYGARIFAHAFRQTGGDVERALLRYNGCVRGTNTPDCHTYPYHVYARAGRASILAWLRPHPANDGGR